MLQPSLFSAPAAPGPSLTYAEQANRSSLSSSPHSFTPLSVQLDSRVQLFDMATEPLPSIIRRPTSPPAATLSPTFKEASPPSSTTTASSTTTSPPSSNNPLQPTQGYFSPLLSPAQPGTPVPSSILIRSPQPQQDASFVTNTGTEAGRSSAPPSRTATPLQLNQVNDGLGIESDTTTSPQHHRTTSPPPPPVNNNNNVTELSPPVAAPATVESAFNSMSKAIYAADEIGRPSRSPSPHCHFAPLPKVGDADRPGTRRNSLAQGSSNRVRPFTSNSTSGEYTLLGVSLFCPFRSLPSFFAAFFLLRVVGQARRRGSGGSRRLDR